MNQDRQDQPGMARSGRLSTPGDRASPFLPHSLPPLGVVDPSVYEYELGSAMAALGRLDAVVDFVPDPEWFVYGYVRRESLLSSQIEGTQASLDDLLVAEALPERADEVASDVGEVINHVRAMEFGIRRLDEIPLSGRLIREMHAELMRGGRGGHRDPGEFRRTQNWVGRAGGGIEEAVYVPPPPQLLGELMGNLEWYLNEDDKTPTIVRCGIAHVQFETIHPFLDGNGRLGRLLITLLLRQRGVLRRPLLYLSLYFKEHRGEYYDSLNRVRFEGDWEGWLRFFLVGVSEVATAAVERARELIALRAELERSAAERRARYDLPFVQLLFRKPILDASRVERELGCAAPTAFDLIRRYSELGVLSELTGRSRGRVYRFDAYLDRL